MIDAAAQVPRSSALVGVIAGARLTFELGGHEAILELRRAIDDVREWYP
jgi:hypothetical protein